MSEQGASDSGPVLSLEEEKELIKQHAALTKRISDDKAQLDTLNKDLGPLHAKKIGPALDDLKALIDSSVISTAIRKELEPKLVDIVQMITDKYEMNKIYEPEVYLKRPTVDVPMALLAWMKSNANSVELAKSRLEIEREQGVPETHKFKQNQWDKFKEDNNVKTVMEGNNKRSVKYHLYTEKMKSSGS